MTKILVVSDSHGGYWRLREAIESEPSAKVVFFLGDGERDIEKISEEYPNRFFHVVQGNCDWGSTLPVSVTDEIEGKRIYACHGHSHLVKYGTADLVSAAKAQDAAIALYGHTHNPDTHYADGVLLFNPGSIREGKYGIIDLAKNGILPVLRNLK